MNSLPKLLLISGVLLGPLVIRTLKPQLEPYPAVLFPAGAGKVDLEQETVSFRRLALVSIDQQGVEHALSPRKFFEPIPVQYWPRIARNRLGLRAGGRGDSHRSSVALRRKEVLDWIGRRLAACGRQHDRAIRVTWSDVSLDVSTGREIDRVTAGQFEVRLDD